MNYPMTSQLEKLAKMRHQTPAQIIAEAIKIGLARLYTESILNQYLNKKISRRKAAAIVGLPAVKLAEEQDQMMCEDIAWGMRHG